MHKNLYVAIILGANINFCLFKETPTVPKGLILFPLFLSPSSLTYEDTYNTLKYADRAKQIKTKVS